MALLKIHHLMMVLLLTIIGSLANAADPVCPSTAPLSQLSRAHFPQGFVFGTAASSYQIEGAVTEGCRGPSLWDHYCKTNPEKCSNSTGDVAVDFYHRYKEDIGLMKNLNTDAFRLSIAWPRIFPHGKMEYGVSEAGVKFYHDVIDELLDQGITPHVTLFHWDTPQFLEFEYGGFLSERIVKDFREYANFTFHQYGGKVKNWITFNEPWVFSRAGYDIGKKAPGRCSSYVHKKPDEPKNKCLGGQSGHEAYNVSHNLLNAHAEAVEAFRACEKCKGGKIGIAHSPAWLKPHDPTNRNDIESVERALDFMLGWHLEPTTSGDYPERMKKILGKRLPKFTDEQKAKLKDSTDFVGMNYYSAMFAKFKTNPDPSKPSWNQDSGVTWIDENLKELKIGSMPNGSTGGPIYSNGLRELLKYIKEKYKNPEIMIMENGYGEELGDNISIEDSLVDNNRETYLSDHLSDLKRAICIDKVNVTAYFVWSLLDNFEWQDGYKTRFGLYYVDYKNNLTRHEKESAKLYRKFLSPSPISQDEL